MPWWRAIQTRLPEILEETWQSIWKYLTHVWHFWDNYVQVLNPTMDITELQIINLLLNLEYKQTFVKDEKSRPK